MEIMLIQIFSLIKRIKNAFITMAIAFAFLIKDLNAVKSFINICPWYICF